MGGRRQERLAEEIKREMSALIFEGLKDPRIDPATVSVTRVEVSKDYSHARVFISVLGERARAEETMAVLERARGFLRSELAGRLGVRHAPEISLRLDRSIEHGVRIAALLNELRAGDAGEGSHEGE
ncbi:MAG: 30S ribosome-binding factor RbfA [Syntrophomonadaceae bacterium]|jgi:ribosome-binding factor A|nr:30S ribosome-binding factor RbfA [Syntrophomonadaceae bacterium]MDH7498330.1 30S ribosome-binding factor RbfA [Syntrophomonadaceae bacterium]